MSTLRREALERLDTTVGRSILTNCCVILFLTLVGTSVLALPISYQAGDSSLTAAVAATLPARRLAELETNEGAVFWTRRLHRDGPRALEALGYYEAQLAATLDGDAVVVRIDEGPPTLVSDIHIEIIGAEQAIPATFPLASGDRLQHHLYETGKSQIHAWLLANGYLNAQLIEHRVEVTRQQRSAAIRLTWDAGPQHQFGPTSFDGSSLDENFLRRYVPFAEGDAFSESGLQELSRTLRASGYFNAVDLRPQPAAADAEHSVPIAVGLTPVSRSSYQFGITLGTDRGPGVDAEVKRRLVNTRGHRWEARAEAAVRRQFVAGRYELPSARRAERTRLLDFNWVDEQTDSADRVTTRAAFSLQDQWRGWRRTDAINILNERYEVGDADETESTLAVGSIELFRREADDPINPSAGWRARAIVSGATEALASSTDFVRGEFSYKRVGSFSANTRWLARGRLGALWTDDFAELPTSLRFYAGGDNSVRGFDYEALGPRDADGDVLGGEYVGEASIELDHLFRPNWRWAVFADAGNAFGEGRESPEYAIGAGLRWLSPIGPLRLDIASALSEPGDELRIHFSAGPDL